MDEIDEKIAQWVKAQPDGFASLSPELYEEFCLVNPLRTDQVLISKSGLRTKVKRLVQSGVLQDAGTVQGSRVVYHPGAHVFEGRVLPPLAPDEGVGE